MTPERWQKVDEVLQATLDRPPPERAAYLRTVCSGDDELQEEASSLIDAYDEAGDFIEEPAIAQDAHILISGHELSNIGREIGPYKIIERLGGGGMGEVYLAQDARLARLVALKILPPYFVSDDARLRRFQTEARAASALNHPNILTIHEVGQFEDIHYIATEYIDGQTIGELMRTENLSLREVFDISGQFVSGLSAAHADGIIHRDIKPENIMQRTDGIVKILDFGIAKLMEQTTSKGPAWATSISKAETEIGVMLGTVGYMSPEQMRGLPVDERTDIWSSGVVLYEMLTHRQPFEGVTRADAIVAILEREPAPLFAGDESQVALREMQRIVSKALRKERSERYQSAAEMLVDLNQISQQLEIEDASGGPATITSLTSVDEVHAIAARRTPARHQRLVILSAAVLIGLLMVTALLYQRWSRTRAAQESARQASMIKPYSQMSPAEQLAFVEEQEQRISAMMGERPVKLNDEALRTIKRYVDRYAARRDSASLKPGVENLRVVYERAPPYVPVISRAFAARRIPIVIGLYLPMIESEYKPCYENNIGAKGLFQFLPDTARSYGVARADMCDVEKMAPAAAHYIADRMAELGDDSQSMTLVLLSYNRGTSSVLDALRLLRESDNNYERNFWTLFANRDKLDDSFRNESAGYIPAFFAVAIIGENPKAFDLQMPALSSLAQDSGVRKE